MPRIPLASENKEEISNVSLTVVIFSVLLVIVVFVALVWQGAEALTNNQTREWERFCSKLNAQYDADFQVCIRDGKVVYPR